MNLSSNSKQPLSYRNEFSASRSSRPTEEDRPLQSRDRFDSYENKSVSTSRQVHFQDQNQLPSPRNQHQQQYQMLPTTRNLLQSIENQKDSNNYPLLAEERPRNNNDWRSSGYSGAPRYSENAVVSDYKRE